MTKEEILQEFSDINYAYNNSSKYDTLKRMLDELTDPKWYRLYQWLDDMRDCIDPDETVTDIEEWNDRIIQVDLLDDIIEWMMEQTESEDHK